MVTFQGCLKVKITDYVIFIQPFVKITAFYGNISEDTIFTILENYLLKDIPD